MSAIFTRLTNEVREDNAVLLMHYRKEMINQDPIRHRVSTKFMSAYELDKKVTDEVESIIFEKSLMASHNSVRSSQLDIGTFFSTNSTNSNTTLRVKSRQKMLDDRHNEMKHLTSKWHRGPVAIGQVQYY